MQGGGQAKTGMVNTGARINYNTAELIENYKKEHKKIAQLSEALRMADEDFQKLKHQESEIANQKRLIP